MSPPLTPGMRLLYGLDRLPASMAHDDPRLPHVILDASPLRLNTVPLPPTAWPEATTHDARMNACRDWLVAACGDYNRPARDFMARYLDSVATHVARHADELAALLARFDGLYLPEDYCWSAPRPLPRAWLPAGRVDIAFWDGTHAHSVTISTLPAGDLIETVLPAAFRQFWTGEALPVSPFRRSLAA